MENTIEYLEFQGQKYPMMFDLNVMEELQNKYGSIDVWANKIYPANGEMDFGCLINTTKEIINEGIDFLNFSEGLEMRFISKKQAGRIITLVGANVMVQKINDLVSKSNKTNSESKN